MKVPLSSANGPNDMAFLQPTTSVKKSTACFMSGTVMPVWSWPRMPGMESADAVPMPPAIVAAEQCCRRIAFFMSVSSVRGPLPFVRRRSPLAGAWADALMPAP